MKILYFAWIRTKLGIEQEVLDLPDGVDTVEDLLTWLKSRNEQFAEVLENDDVIRVAVNQEHAQKDIKITDSDEIALFPPITGGRY